MARVSLNYEIPIEPLVKEAIERRLITAVEIIPDNYAYQRKRELKALMDSLGVPYTFHFVGMSLGSADYREVNDLAANAALVRDLDPLLVSDHLNCCRSGNLDLRQNMDVPRNEDMLDLFVSNIALTRKKLGKGCAFLIENVAAHIDFASSTMTPLAFYRDVVVRSGASFLLDVHNLYVDEVNHGIDGRAFIESLPAELIREVHIAGGEWSRSRKTYMDTHSMKTPTRVFELLEAVLRRANPDILLLERRSLGDLRQVRREILEDLEIINGINRRWTRRRSKSSVVSSTNV